MVDFHTLSHILVVDMKQLVIVIIVVLTHSTDGLLPDCVTCADGNTAPYHIIQPSTNDDVQTVSPDAETLSLKCSLNVTIPSGMTITWLHNDSVVHTFTTQADQLSNTVSLLRGRPEPSDAGVYQCVFNDTAGYVVRENITLLLLTPMIVQPPADFHIVTFDELTSSVQLTCSLNVIIPHSVIVTWIHNSNGVITTSSNEIIQTGNTTTLLIRNPQPSDAGDYQCVFSGLNLQRIIVLEFQNSIIISTPKPTLATSVATISNTATTASHSTTKFATSYITATTTDTLITTDVATVVTASVDLSVTATTTSANTTITFNNSPTLPTSQSNNNNNNSNNFSVGVLLVAVVVAFIIITVVVVGIIVVCCKRNKSKRHTQQKSIHYSINDETILQKSPTNKAEPACSKTKGQESKNCWYMNIPTGIHSAKQADRLTMQNNKDPDYMNTEGIHSAKQAEGVITQDKDLHYVNSEAVHTTKQADRLTMQNNKDHNYMNTEGIHSTKQAEGVITQDKDLQYVNSEDVHATKQAGKNIIQGNIYSIPFQDHVRMQNNPSYVTSSGAIINTEYSYAATAYY